jgi:hypothetical protein
MRIDSSKFRNRETGARIDLEEKSGKAKTASTKLAYFLACSVANVLLAN